MVRPLAVVIKPQGQVGVAMGKDAVRCDAGGRTFLKGGAAQPFRTPYKRMGRETRMDGGSITSPR
jgi:hypothetical protein